MGGRRGSFKEEGRENEEAKGGQIINICLISMVYT